MEKSNAAGQTSRSAFGGPAEHADPVPLAKIDVETRALAALVNLRLRDNKLLEYEVHELTICGRLAMYLQCLFPTYDVDIDYNKDGSQTKALHGQHVRPDIIVHKRGHRHSNLLAIELKKSPVSEGDRQRDNEKLTGYRQNLGYRFAIQIEIPVGCAAASAPVIRWVDATETHE